MIFWLFAEIEKAQPNPRHYALGELENRNIRMRDYPKCGWTASKGKEQESN